MWLAMTRIPGLTVSDWLNLSGTQLNVLRRLLKRMDEEASS